MPGHQQAFVRRVHRTNDEPKTTNNTPSKPKDGRQTRSKSFNLPETPVSYSTSGVRDRVLRWQQLAAEEDATEQAKVNANSPEAGGKRTKDKRNQSKSNEAAIEEEGSQERQTTQLLKLVDQSPTKTAAIVGLSSAPKKRVVSDEHWRHKNAPAKQQNRNGAAHHESAFASREYVAKPAGRATAPKYDAWVRPRQAQRKSIKASPDKGQGQKNNSSSPRKEFFDDVDDDRTSMKPELPRSDDGLDLHERKKESTHISIFKTRVVAETTTAAASKPIPAKVKTSSRSTSATNPANPTLNRIEAWLGGTQDPFIDQTIPDPSPRPLHAFENGSETDSRPVVDRWVMPGEENSKHRSVQDEDTAEGRHRKISDLDSVLKLPLENDGRCVPWTNTSNSSQTSPSLKRSGARRSRYSLLSAPRSADDSHARGREHLGREDKGDTIGQPSSLESSKRRARRDRPRIKRKTTSEADLMSVLSMPQHEGTHLMSACSIRRQRAQPRSGQADELIQELRADEEKYAHELKTLVDGVIPVLLTSTLSKSKSSIGSVHRGSKPLPSLNATAPIVSMGVALERLKSAHSRMPLERLDEVLNWAQTSQQIYSDYLKAWRMGFDDMMIDLAPAEDEQSPVSRQPLLLNKPDALVNEGSSKQAKSQSADVAFLLKRPLVRLKYLSKTLRSIDERHSTSMSQAVVRTYQDLVMQARRRIEEERARLEDEAAASIDTTRARDPTTLAPLYNVSIDQNLCVGARDLFDMHLKHSSGQTIDCRVEIIYRGDRADPAKICAGDVLICEIDGPQRWILLPPVRLDRISARHGDSSSELVVMIRGTNDAGDWYEMLSLKTLANQAEASCVEWLEMLGTHPVPPRASPDLTFALKAGSVSQMIVQDLSSKDMRKGDPLSPSELDIPFGERASTVSQSLRDVTSDVNHSATAISPIGPAVIDFATVEKRPPPVSMPLRPPAGSRTQAEQNAHSSRVHERSKHAVEPTNALQRFGKALGLGQTGTSSMSPGLPDHFSAVGRSVPTTPSNRNRREVRRPMSDTRSTSSRSRSDNGYAVWLPSEDHQGSREESFKKSDDNLDHRRRPYGKHSQVSGHMSLRSTSPSRQEAKNIEEATYLDYSAKYRSTKELRNAENPSSGFASPQTPPSTEHTRISAVPQTTPSRTAGHASQTHTPTFTPPLSGPNSTRRSSSPLKHEYAPSSSSEASSLHEDVLFDDDKKSITSESSTEDIVPPLPPLSALKKGLYRAPPSSAYSPRNAATLVPSQSASQAPYRGTPSSPKTSSKMIASIYSWSEKGFWDPLHPDECSIIVSPGLIEAFELSAAHSLPANYRAESNEGLSLEKDANVTKPLIGLELTPLVLLRRGTAIDISIRSPPTEISQLKPSSNNIMFRSRNNQECDTLYGMINQARINNPTYIALQNARGPFGQSNWGVYMDQQAASRTSGSWWRLGGSKRSSYRATSTRQAGSVAQQTESSVVSMSSAISALKRFSTGNKMFNVAKSTISSRGGIGIGSKSSTTFSSSSGGKASGSGGASGNSGSSTPITPVDPSQSAPTSITDAKVRMYSREAASRWRDMGSARLSIMHPPRPPGQPPQLTKDGKLKQEKRIVIIGKTKGETLLDVTLGEGSFERVARTGIAVSVWEQRGEIGKSGGVMTTSVKVFMIQMKSEAEAAYTFSLVGRLRY